MLTPSHKATPVVTPCSAHTWLTLTSTRISSHSCTFACYSRHAHKPSPGHAEIHPCSCLCAHGGIIPHTLARLPGMQRGLRDPNPRAQLGSPLCSTPGHLEGGRWRGRASARQPSPSFPGAWHGHGQADQVSFARAGQRGGAGDVEYLLEVINNQQEGTTACPRPAAGAPGPRLWARLQWPL